MTTPLVRCPEEPVSALQVRVSTTAAPVFALPVRHYYSQYLRVLAVSAWSLLVCKCHAVA